MKHVAFLLPIFLLLTLPLIAPAQTPQEIVDTLQKAPREMLTLQKVFPLMNLDMEIYPNPVRDKLYLRIDAPSFRLVWLTLYNCNGQVLQNRQIQIPNTLEMNVQDLSPGVYLLRVTDGETVLTKRMMRQR